MGLAVATRVEHSHSVVGREHLSVNAVRHDSAPPPFVERLEQRGLALLAGERNCQQRRPDNGDGGSVLAPAGRCDAFEELLRSVFDTRVRVISALGVACGGMGDDDDCPAVTRHRDPDICVEFGCHDNWALRWPAARIEGQRRHGGGVPAARGEPRERHAVRARAEFRLAETARGAA